MTWVNVYSFGSVTVILRTTPVLKFIQSHSPRFVLITSPTALSGRERPHPLQFNRIPFGRPRPDLDPRPSRVPCPSVTSITLVSDPTRVRSRRTKTDKVLFQDLHLPHFHFDVHSTDRLLFNPLSPVVPSRPVGLVTDSDVYTLCRPVLAKASQWVRMMALRVPLGDPWTRPTPPPDSWTPTSTTTYRSDGRQGSRRRRDATVVVPEETVVGPVTERTTPLSRDYPGLGRVGGRPSTVVPRFPGATLSPPPLLSEDPTSTGFTWTHGKVEGVVLRNTFPGHSTRRHTPCAPQ